MSEKRETTYLINHENQEGFITQSTNNSVDLAGVQVNTSILSDKGWESVSKEEFDKHLDVGTPYHYANPREILS
ncbi:MAG: hypothetical protein F6K28_54245 [Microcoleus sp. SIO2G3]|nr:hypothetical protein [Microcoleus sp. SIO2G3]